MCVAQPSYTNPLHILQGINALLLPQLPLLLTSTEIQRVQVRQLLQLQYRCVISNDLWPSAIVLSGNAALVMTERVCV
jgi:hypothetical protein